MSIDCRTYSATIKAKEDAVDTILFIIQLFCCFSLFGLIWTIQLVHYPAFLEVDSKRFANFSEEHSNNISFFVAPLMIVEFATGALLLFNTTNALFITNFIGILIIWYCTFFISVPCHQKLSVGKDIGVIRKLINTNWIRTIIWTVRSIILLSILIRKVN